MPALNKKIKNVLFDLGGVLIDIDYNRTIQAFEALGFGDFDKMYSQYAADDLFIGLEKGMIGPELFYETILSKGKPGLTNEDIKQAWNSILLDFRSSSLGLLPELRKKYRLYLLSNTNIIHHQAFSEIFRNQSGLGRFEDYFDKAYYSHEMNMRKPDAEAYLFVVNDAGIQPEETLFIDDTITNIDAAEKLGFQTHLLEKGASIEGFFETGNLI